MSAASLVRTEGLDRDAYHADTPIPPGRIVAKGHVDLVVEHEQCACRGGAGQLLLAVPLSGTVRVGGQVAAAVGDFLVDVAAVGFVVVVEQATRQLAVGAVFFNDLKKDMKGPVPIARGEVQPTIAAFEKSGGPYVVYPAVRARSILRKYGKTLPEAAEALLILRLLEYSGVVVKAAESDDPAVLVRYLLEIAGLYNPYYAAAPVLRGAEANLFRILVTRSVELTLVNGLSLCHVECPPQI